MQIIRDIKSFNKFYTGKISIALGNFDGVHRGHRKILSTIAEKAGSGCKTAVLIFDPHPLAVLDPARAPLLLQTLEDRIQKLGQAGIDYTIIYPFTPDFSLMQPEQFVTDILLKYFDLNLLVVGFDYTFGHRGRGRAEDLARLGVKYGFSVKVVEPVVLDEIPIASSVIRNYLSAGYVDKAEKMLGYPYFLRGAVVHGDARGRKLGFPTANLQASADVILPAKGVYLTLTCLPDGKNDWSLTNIGSRPTFYKAETTVEVYLLDSAINLYGKELVVHFIQKIRDEKAFSSSAELISQIKLDIIAARNIISRTAVSEIRPRCGK